MLFRLPSDVSVSLLSHSVDTGILQGSALAPFSWLPFIHPKSSSAFPLKTLKPLCPFDLSIIIPSASPLISLSAWPAHLIMSHYFLSHRGEKPNLFWAYALPQPVITPATFPPNSNLGPPHVSPAPPWETPVFEVIILKAELRSCLIFSYSQRPSDTPILGIIAWYPCALHAQAPTYLFKDVFLISPHMYSNQMQQFLIHKHPLFISLHFFFLVLFLSSHSFRQLSPVTSISQNPTHSLRLSINIPSLWLQQPTQSLSLWD